MRKIFTSHLYTIIYVGAKNNYNLKLIAGALDKMQSYINELTFDYIYVQ